MEVIIERDLVRLLRRNARGHTDRGNPLYRRSASSIEHQSCIPAAPHPREQADFEGAGLTSRPRVTNGSQSRMRGGCQGVRHRRNVEVSQILPD
jgi:hypothetical protein